MASVDMFDKTFKIADMKSKGKIKWRQEQVNFLSAHIIQVNGAGEITGGAYAVATKNPEHPDVFPPITNNVEQPTWELTMRMMPGRRLQVGMPATGLALYRRTGAQLAVWITAGITIEA
jgi:hypothetical protein